MPKTGVSKDVLLDGAQMSIAGIIAGVAGFLKEKGIPFEEMVAYMGAKFDGSLGDLEGRGADEVMDHLLALEVLPMGTTVISREGDEKRAEAVLTPLPPGDLLEKFGTTPRVMLRDFGVTLQEYARIFGMFEPAARAIGLKFHHGLKNGREVISLEKASDAD